MAEWTITQEAFDRLLSWLDPDPDRGRAGQVYEGIRRKLILFFASRGGAAPEEMADECINRVIQKLPEIIGHYTGLPEYYFFGVARMILLEWPRKERPVELPVFEASPPERERDLTCLDLCLERLTISNREIVLGYYHHEKRAKIDHRAALAMRLGIAINALRIRAHRIRLILEKCMLQCVREKAPAQGEHV